MCLCNCSHMFLLCQGKRRLVSPVNCLHWASRGAKAGLGLLSRVFSRRRSFASEAQRKTDAFSALFTINNLLSVIVASQFAIEFALLPFGPEVFLGLALTSATRSCRVVTKVSCLRMRRNRSCFEQSHTTENRLIVAWLTCSAVCYGGGEVSRKLNRKDCRCFRATVRKADPAIMLELERSGGTFRSDVPFRVKMVLFDVSSTMRVPNSKHLLCQRVASATGSYVFHLSHLAFLQLATCPWSMIYDPFIIQRISHGAFHLLRQLTATCWSCNVSHFGASEHERNVYRFCRFHVRDDCLHASPRQPPAVRELMKRQRYN